MDIERKTTEIINIIKNTPEFRNAKDLRNQILKDPNLTAMIKNFQTRQEQLYRRNLPPQQMESEMKKLADNFERMSNTTIINDYAQAVQKVQGMVYNSNMTILESIDKELNI